MQIDLDAISFAEWLIQLDDHAKAQGFKGEPITRQIGQLCWHHYFEEGFTPAAALIDAVANGSAFGGDYLDIENEKEAAC